MITLAAAGKEGQEHEAGNATERDEQAIGCKYISITRRDDGSYHPNFKPMKVDKDFSVAKYASSVANELLWALEGLVKRE